MSRRTAGPSLLRLAWACLLKAGIGPPTSHHNLAAMDHLDVVVVGGCGHVGLPLALSLSGTGYTGGIDALDAAHVSQVRSGNVPFLENGAEELLRKLLPTGRLVLAADPQLLSRTDTVILVLGTPIHELPQTARRLLDAV